MNKTPRTLAATIVLASLVIAGCSSSSKSSSSTAATTATTIRAVTTIAAPTTAVVTTAAPTTAAPTTAAATTAAPTTAAATTATNAASVTTAAAAGADAGTTMTIQGFKFSPLTTKVGTAVTVTNSDTAPHTVTDVAGSFDVKVPAGGTATLTITKPGTYSIHCTIHPKMLSTITVTS